MTSARIGEICGLFLSEIRVVPQFIGSQIAYDIERTAVVGNTVGEEPRAELAEVGDVDAAVTRCRVTTAAISN